MLDSAINFMNDIFWGYVLIYGLLAVGVYFTLRLRFIQFVHFPEMFRCLLGRTNRDPDGISPFQALSVSLASRVGTGLSTELRGCNEVLLDAARLLGLGPGVERRAILRAHDQFAGRGDGLGDGGGRRAIQGVADRRGEVGRLNLLTTNHQDGGAELELRHQAGPNQ